MSVTVSVKEIDRGWNRIKSEIEKIDKSYVKVGVLEEAGAYEEGQTIAQVAGWNEYGTTRIPARPFMRQTFEKYGDEIQTQIKGFLGKIIDGKESVAVALKKVGEMAKGKIQKTISSGQFAENRPATKEQKGAKKNKPLIDTGRLRQSINYEVTEK